MNKQMGDDRVPPKDEGRYYRDEMDDGGEAADGSDSALRKFRTATSISMSPELFEKLYLSPQNRVKGNLRATFANPSPIGLAGFLLCLTPLSMDLMGWRGAGANGSANSGAFYFQGGFLMNLGCILEWVIGNTLPAVVFGVYGTFWLAFAASLNPAFGAMTLFAPPDAKSPLAGLKTEPYNASLAWWFLFMGLISFIFLVCSVRTNVCFFIIFLCLVISFNLQVAGNLASAENFTGNEHYVSKIRVGAGAATFVACWSGWYILTASLLAAVDFPFQLPVGDLSTVVKGKQQRSGKYVRRE
ncbi:hypothetical protein HIM_08625 [Hirsutella minnesotensis 3608]|uniref:Protein alcS n=1 Tax=Hirsutella minnesotensis 3608 TaxID=1043627 RepID=A0A0F7ZMD0_9HYPO|nr:hypothetical protein HIM_08625 [Hirsutella minnesotensis 3608]